MNDDLDTHEKIVRAMLRYSEANTRFELFGFMTSSRVARMALSELYKLVRLRRQEIKIRREQIHGHKELGIEPTEPNDRRKRKIQRNLQKQQAKNQDTDT